MKTADFEVTLDGKARRVVSTARLYRGPGASEVAAMRQKTMPGDDRPRVEPSRVVLLVVDQGSLLAGDERRVRVVAENCLWLLGLGDQLGLMLLPGPEGQLPVHRDAIRPALAKVHGLRALDDTALAAGAEHAEKRPDPFASIQPVTAAAERTGATPARPDARPQALEKLEDSLSAGKLGSGETVSAAAAKSHAVAALGDLAKLLTALRHMPGAKTILLLSAGMSADDVSGEIERVAAAAAAGNTRIYALQVPTPARKFAEIGESGLLAIARASGGALVTLGEKPGEALQRMAAELSFSYLLMLEPLPEGDMSSPHSLSVSTRRKGVTIRSSAWLVPGRLLPEALPEPKPPAPNPTREAPIARRDPALDAVLARVADYVQNYCREVSAVVTEEVYEQQVLGSMAGAGVVTAVRQESRRLVSDFLLVKVPGDEGWLPLRDVLEVDGKQVRERDNRLQKLFIEASADEAIENANRILEESARYNIGPVRRNLNVPTLPLMFVHGQNAGRFTFTKRGEEDEGGMRTWVVEYRELVKPTIIKTPAGADVPASGRFWVEPTSGRIVRTTLEAGGATITVIYRPYAEAPGVWLPASMDERYGTRIRARASYSNVRRFRVFTEEKIKEPKIKEPDAGEERKESSPSAAAEPGSRPQPEGSERASPPPGAGGPGQARAAVNTTGLMRPTPESCDGGAPRDQAYTTGPRRCAASTPRRRELPGTGP